VLAYAEDTQGRRVYTVRLKNLVDGRIREENIDLTSGAIAWSRDSGSVFYVKKHPETLLPYRVCCHILGSDPSTDRLVYEEADNTFYTTVYNTRSRDYVVIHLMQTLSSEIRLLDADDPDGDMRIFLPREPDHEYSIDQIGRRFFIRTNWEAENFRLMETTLEESQAKENWKELIPARPDVFFDDFQVFQNYLVVNERTQGQLTIRILPLDGGEGSTIASDEPVYLMAIDRNPDLHTDKLRYSYESLSQPACIYEYDMKSGERTLLKQDEVVGDFDPARYQTERLWAKARDGAKVPISLVFRKSTKKPAPLYLTAYGSYGFSFDPVFTVNRLSLLDRGLVYAIVGVRGGQELGRQWYEDGKLLKKWNTFTDFIDAAECLVAEGYARPDAVFAQGGSAGGLLMGVVANSRPDLFCGIVAHVPFVDIVTSMLDESIPLTTGEYDEWGNPNEEEQYRYMLSYSPYDQVKRQDYPHLLITAGLHDSQVQYWEPVKWAAKLRANKTDNHKLLVHINMEAGHSGQSGRFRRFRETALEYAFILDLLGIGE
jgi:oligopeptidase B